MIVRGNQDQKVRNQTCTKQTDTHTGHAQRFNVVQFECQLNLLLLFSCRQLRNDVIVLKGDFNVRTELGLCLVESRKFKLKELIEKKIDG